MKTRQASREKPAANVNQNDPRDSSVGGAHTIFIFRGEPEEYNLPSSPEVPTVHLKSGWQSAAVAAGMMLAGVAAAFFIRRSTSD